VPGPGHPGHFPKPPGWIDSPGQPSSAGGGPSRPLRTSGSAGGSPGAGPSGGPTAGPATGPAPESGTPADTGAGHGERGAATPSGGGTTRAQDAAAKVAEMLGRQETADGEAVDEAAEAVEHDIDLLAKAEAQRDEYLDSLRRLQADFENYKKRIARQHADIQERAAEKLVESLLPVLDNFDLAMSHAAGDAGLEPIHRSLLTVLGAAGLERMDPAGQPFDPNEHDAVLHEPGGDSGEPEVIEVMRAGYRWKGRVLRPAMVKVKG
jgi:molecular chaperone GrpE